MGALTAISEDEQQIWREGLHEFDAQNELIAFAIMCAFTKPDSWLDVGSGTGAVVYAALANRVNAYGIDQLADSTSPYFRQIDLRQAIDLNRTFAIVTSIEVVEHLEPEFDGVICDTLVRHVAPGGYLILTSAKPGQPGYNHFNCQPLKYWRDRIESRGMRYSQSDTVRLAAILSHTYTALHHLEENLQVFRR